MKYLSVTFHIDCAPTTLRDSADLLAAIAGETGFEAFEERPDGIVGYVQAALFDDSAMKTLLLHFPIAGAKITYEVASVPDVDWNTVWEDAGFSPIRIGPDCTIYDARHTDREALVVRPLDLFIETEQAFGTGTHATTRLILSEMIRRRERIAGASVLDCGTGTGILAIMASRLGASRVAAYDIDDWSVRNARHNARLNGDPGIDIRRGDGATISCFGGAFDVVVANINRNVLLADMERFRSAMLPSGVLILSGFYADDVPLLELKARSSGLAPIGTTTEEGWACALFG